MRIASKNAVLYRSLIAAALFTAGFASPVCAADPSPLAIAPAQDDSGAAAVAAAASQAPPAPAVPTTLPPQPSSSATATATAGSTGIVLSKPQGETIEKSVAAMEQKAVESGNIAVKQLEVVVDPTTYADLNRARQTATRIDAIIDVEKRLAELDKIRSQRRDFQNETSSLAAAIPASALTPPANGAQGEKPVAVAKPAPRPDVTRIYGSGGKYVAVLKFEGDTIKSVKVGDKISKNEVVRSITSSSIEIGGKQPYTLHVKNVDVVYSTIR